MAYKDIFDNVTSSYINQTVPNMVQATT